MITTYQRTGAYHKKNKLECQDVIFQSESNTATIIAIADGVSSCENSKRGAEIACKAVSDIMLGETEYIFASPREKAAGLLISYVQGKLREEAAKGNSSFESYSSTLSFVCFNKLSGEIMSFVLGDSLLYLMMDGKLTLACTTEHFSGNQTYTTTTDGVEKVVEIKRLYSYRNVKFVLATDGAWREFYENGAVCSSAEIAMLNNDIAAYLDNKPCSDDCSIAIFDIAAEEGE